MAAFDRIIDLGPWLIGLARWDALAEARLVFGRGRRGI